MIDRAMRATRLPASLFSSRRLEKLHGYLLDIGSPCRRRRSFCQNTHRYLKKLHTNNCLLSPIIEVKFGQSALTPVLALARVASLDVGGIGLVHDSVDHGVIPTREEEAYASLLIEQKDLKKQRNEQVSFLERSSRTFDEGYKDEAKRLAVTLRMLPHNTNRSKSLLHQLGWNANFIFEPRRLDQLIRSRPLSI